MAEEGFGFDKRRLPSIEKNISEIKSDDLRLKLLGTIIDKKDSNLIIDDGTGNITIRFEEPIQTEPGKLVRVFGRVVPSENGFDVHGELIQDATGLDMDLYKKAKKIGGVVNV